MYITDIVQILFMTDGTKSSKNGKTGSSQSSIKDQGEVLVCVLCVVHYKSIIITIYTNHIEVQVFNGEIVCVHVCTCTCVCACVHVHVCISAKLVHGTHV